MRHELYYTSIFSFSPRNMTEEGETAYEFVKCLKNNWPVRGKDFPSALVAKNLNKILQDSGSLRNVFHEWAILVPVPRASLTREDNFWPSREIAKELESLKLGKVLTLLERVERVNPSSKSRPQDRPTPTQHYRSFSIKKKLPSVDSVVLVDDVVTRGHTLMGAAWKIEEAYPDIGIHAFAAFRTISNPDEFRRFVEPVELGTIIYRSDKDDCLRRP